MTHPKDNDERRIQALRDAGVAVYRRTPGKRLIIDADGRYREVGREIPTGQALFDGQMHYLWEDGSHSPVAEGPEKPSEARTPEPRGL